MKGVTTLLEFQDVKWQLPSGEPIIKGITCKLDSRLTVITGPNGGGKTSLAKLIAGVEKCTSGKILLDGTDITDMDITGRAKLGIAYAFQQPVRFKGLTVRDLLELSAGEKLGHNELCALLGKGRSVCGGIYRQRDERRFIGRRGKAYRDCDRACKKRQAVGI